MNRQCRVCSDRKNVMPGLDPGIHAVPAPTVERSMEWIAGSSPAMTTQRVPRSALFDQRLKRLELGRAGTFHPLEQNHLAVDHVDAGFLQAGKRELAARFRAGTDGIGHDESLEPLGLQVDGGLQNADMGLDAADHDLGAALAAQLMQPVLQHRVPRARELLSLIHISEPTRPY